jgi:formylmethanofuran dehydrogenase subunit A
MLFFSILYNWWCKRQKALSPISAHTKLSVPTTDMTVQEITDQMGHNQKDNLKDYWWTHEQFNSFMGTLWNMTNSLTFKDEM